MGGVALTEASRYIQTHAEYSDHIYKGMTILNFTKTILENSQNISALDDVKIRVSEIEKNKLKQEECYNTARRFLNFERTLNVPLFLTWGYERKTNLTGFASINVAHKFYDNFPNEIWMDCTVQVTKASLKKAFPAPFPKESINQPSTLLAYVENEIFIRGIGEYVGFSTASNNKMNTFNNFKSSLSEGANFETLKTKYIDHQDWDDVGQHMAYVIANKLGEEVLIKTISGGSKAFFDTFNDIKNN